MLARMRSLGLSFILSLREFLGSRIQICFLLSKPSFLTLKLNQPNVEYGLTLTLLNTLLIDFSSLSCFHFIKPLVYTHSSRKNLAFS